MNGRSTTTSTSTIQRLPRELDYRENDGVQVWLLWRTADDQLFVLVRDERRGETFQLDVDPAEALDAFHHPYAHAAFRGVECGPAEHLDERVAA